MDIRFARDFEGTWSSKIYRRPHVAVLELKRVAQKSQNNGYFCSKIVDLGAIEALRASRSDAIEDREAMLPGHRR